MFEVKYEQRSDSPTTILSRASLLVSVELPLHRGQIVVVLGDVSMPSLCLSRVTLRRLHIKTARSLDRFWGSAINSVLVVSVIKIWSPELKAARSPRRRRASSLISRSSRSAISFCLTPPSIHSGLSWL